MPSELALCLLSCFAEHSNRSVGHESQHVKLLKPPKPVSNWTLDDYGSDEDAGAPYGPLGRYLFVSLSIAADEAGSPSKAPEAARDCAVAVLRMLLGKN